MSVKENFENEAEEKIKNLDKAIEKAETQEEIDALNQAKEELVTTVELSEEAEEWIKKQEERTKLINEWKEETEYEYKKNMDIINDTLHVKLKDNIDEWYEEFKGDDIIDKEALKRTVEAIEYDFMMSENVELETKVVYAQQSLSGNGESYCVVVDYKFIMDENMSMHKKWKFDILDIIRDNKLGWLFD